MSTEDSPAFGASGCRPIQIILVATSLEDESDQVVRAGLAVARAAGGRVYLVHAARIVPPFVGFEVATGPDSSEEQIGWWKEALDRQIERLGIVDAELAGASVLNGPAHQIVIDVAEKIGAGLIVVGATGSGPLSAELLGSTADRILRKAACPVLVARGELPVPPRYVLAPVDLSPLSGDTFRCGLGILSQISKSGEVEVRAIHALSFLDALALRRQRAEEVSFEQIQSLEAEELRRFVDQSQVGPHFRVETAVLPGEARFEILQELNARPADLVILGTHGRGGFDRLVVGSVASTVARKAPCSVLLISPEAATAR